MRNKLILVLSAIALTVMLGNVSAYADQITLGDTCNGAGTSPNLLSVSGTVNPSVTGSVSNCFASWEQGITTTNISPWSLMTGTSFSVGSGSSLLSGSIDWTAAVSLSGTTTLVGFLTVSSEGSLYNGEYIIGNPYHVDLVLLDGKPSSGEIPVPEPGTLTLLGTGLLTMAGFLRRKIGS